MTTESYTIYDLGYNQSLSKIDNFYDELSRVANIVENGVNPVSLYSGDMFGNFDLVDGHLQSSNFVSGSTGWQITAEGDVEFNTGTFRGILEAGSIHIPDQTTANSFHTETDGDSWWGCNVSNWESNIENAKAYILKTGVAKFQEVTVIGDATHSLQWDKTDLVITGGLIKTGTGDGRVEITTDNTIDIYKDGTKYLNYTVDGIRWFDASDNLLSKIFSGRTSSSISLVTHKYDDLNSYYAFYFNAVSDTYGEFLGYGMGSGSNVNIGNSEKKFKNIYLAGDVNCDGNAIFGGDISGGLKMINSYTCGENITDGDYVCLLKQEKYSTSPTKDTYVDEGNADTNYDGSTTIRIGLSVANSQLSYLQWDISSLPVAEKAYIRIKVSAGSGTGRNTEVKRCTTSWNSTTMTWNTGMPSISDYSVNGITDGQSLSQLVGSYLYLDITDLYNSWKDETYTNYGVRLSMADGLLTLHSLESADDPLLIVYGENSNSNKIYKTDASDNTKTGIIGQATETKTSGQSCKVQETGIVTESGLISMYDYFLSDTSGEISKDAGTVHKKIGQARSATGIELDIGEDTDIGTVSGVIVLSGKDTKLRGRIIEPIICGFKPSRIEFEIQVSQSSIATGKYKQVTEQSSGFAYLPTSYYINGKTYGWLYNNNTPSFTEDTNYIARLQGSGNYDCAVEINKILQSGFVLKFYYLYNDDNSVNFHYNILWKAYK